MNVDVRPVCFCLGLIFGVILVIDVKMHKGVSTYFAHAFTGTLFGMVIAWTIFDVIHAVQNPGELAETVKTSSEEKS